MHNYFALLDCHVHYFYTLAVHVAATSTCVYCVALEKNTGFWVACIYKD